MKNSLEAVCLACCLQSTAKTDTLMDREQFRKGDKNKGGEGGRSQQLAGGLPFVTSQRVVFQDFLD